MLDADADLRKFLGIKNQKTGASLKTSGTGVLLSFPHSPFLPLLSLSSSPPLL